MSKLINIAHELPYILQRSEDLHYEVIPKSHIFGSGLDDFYKENESIWVGRPRKNKRYSCNTHSIWLTHLCVAKGRTEDPDQHAEDCQAGEAD